MAIKIVCANLIVKDEKYLLVKETKKVAADKYNLPAGQLEHGETLVECAVREAFEETGLKVEVENIVGLIQNIGSPEKNNVLIIIFKSKITGGKIKTTKEHPKVAFYSEKAIIYFSKKGILRNNYILDVITNYKNKLTIKTSFLKQC